MLNKLLIFTVLVLATAGFASAQEITGDWQGTLKSAEGELRVALHIVKGDDGSLRATLDSVDQGAIGLPVTTISLHGSKLNFTVDLVSGSYEGTVNADGTEIKGTWTQAEPLPLDFKRVNAPH